MEGGKLEEERERFTIRNCWSENVARENEALVLKVVYESGPGCMTSLGLHWGE